MSKMPAKYKCDVLSSVVLELKGFYFCLATTSILVV